MSDRAEQPGRLRCAAVRRSKARGQAAVETAIILPLCLFCLLGTLQLFLMLHGRITAHYAAFKAVRVGSVNHAECGPMSDAALAALLPAFANLEPGTVGQNFSERKQNRYSYTGADEDFGHQSAVLQLDRLITTVDFQGNEDKLFDQWDGPEGASRLELQLVFWYPLKVPFVNWVMSRMYLAYFNLQAYTAQDPLLLTQQATGWSGSGGLRAGLGPELQRRVQGGEFDFPIVVSHSMRMMSPARSQGGPCP